MSFGEGSRRWYGFVPKGFSLGETEVTALFLGDVEVAATASA